MYKSLIAALAALGAAGAVAVAAPAPAVSAGSWQRTQVIDLVAEQADDDVIDLGQPGFGLGDQLLISDVLYRHGARAGTSGGTCQIVKVVDQRVTVNCVTTLTLRRGQVTVQGLLTVGPGASGPFDAAITGGSGAYRTAHGQMLITPIDADTEHYRLTLMRDH